MRREARAAVFANPRIRSSRAKLGCLRLLRIIVPGSTADTLSWPTRPLGGSREAAGPGWAGAGLRAQSGCHGKAIVTGAMCTGPPRPSLGCRISAGGVGPAVPGNCPVGSGGTLASEAAGTGGTLAPEDRESNQAGIPDTGQSDAHARHRPGWEHCP